MIKSEVVSSAVASKALGPMLRNNGDEGASTSPHDENTNPLMPACHNSLHDPSAASDHADPMDIDTHVSPVNPCLVQKAGQPPTQHHAMCIDHQPKQHKSIPSEDFPQQQAKQHAPSSVRSGPADQGWEALPHPAPHAVGRPTGPSMPAASAYISVTQALERKGTPQQQTAIRPWAPAPAGSQPDSMVGQSQGTVPYSRSMGEAAGEVELQVKWEEKTEQRDDYVGPGRVGVTGPYKAGLPAGEDTADAGEGDELGDDTYKRRTFARHCPRCMGRIRRTQKDLGGPSGGGCVNQTCQKCCFHINIACEYHGYGMDGLYAPQEPFPPQGKELEEDAVAQQPGDSYILQAASAQDLSRQTMPPPRHVQQPGSGCKYKKMVPLDVVCGNPGCGQPIAKTVPLFCPRAFCANCCRTVPGLCKYRGHVYIPVGMRRGSNGIPTGGTNSINRPAKPVPCVSPYPPVLVLDITVKGHLSVQLLEQPDGLVRLDLSLHESVAVSTRPPSKPAQIYSPGAYIMKTHGWKPSSISPLLCKNTSCAIPVSKAASSQCFQGMCKECCVNSRGDRHCSYVGHSYVSKRSQGIISTSRERVSAEVVPMAERKPQPCSNDMCDNMVAYWAFK
eukprot:gene7085-187_t